MVREATDICLQVLKEATKVGSTATVVKYGVMIISHITFRDCRVHFFGVNLSPNSCIKKLTRPHYPEPKLYHLDSKTHLCDQMACAVGIPAIT